MSVFIPKGRKFYYSNFTFRGVQVYKSCKTTNKKEAKKTEERYRKELLDQLINRGSPNISLLAGFIRLYNEHLYTLKDGEQAHRKGMLIVKLLGDVKLKDIDRTKIAELIYKLKERDVKHSTINRYLALLKSLLRTARDVWECLDRIPKIKLFSENNTRTRVLTETEEQNLLRILRTTKLQKDNYWSDIADLVEVLVETGMRVGEALQLTYTKNIDINNREIKLFGSMTKSGKDRVVPMSERCLKVIESRKGTDKPFPFQASYVSRVFKKARLKMGLETDEEFVPHALRHTCASRLLKNTNIYTVSKLLGHSSISITADRYGHLDTKALHEAVNG